MAAKEAMKASCWQIDRNLGLSVIFALVLQFASCVWWASDTSARLDTVEREQARYDRVLEELSTIKANIEWIKRSLEK